MAISGRKLEKMAESKRHELQNDRIGEIVVSKDTTKDKIVKEREKHFSRLRK